MTRIQVLLISDSRFMLAGMSKLIKHEKGEIYECFYENSDSIDSLKPAYQDAFDLIFLGFHDIVKAATAAVTFSKVMPHASIFALIEVGVCHESETILQKISTKVLHRNVPLEDLAQIIADTHDELFMPIRKIKPQKTTTPLTDKEALILYYLQVSIDNHIELEDITRMSRRTIERTMGGLSKKMAVPNNKAALAVASLRVLGDLRLDALGKVVLP